MTPNQTQDLTGNNLYSFRWDDPRGGDIDGLFFAKPEELEAIYGRTVYFGEIRGKHSEVYGDLDRDEVTLVSDDPAIIAALAPFVYQRSRTLCGVSPVEYFADGQEQEDD